MKRCPKCTGCFPDDMDYCDDCKTKLIDRNDFNDPFYKLSQKERKKEKAEKNRERVIRIQKMHK